MIRMKDIHLLRDGVIICGMAFPNLVMSSEGRTNGFNPNDDIIELNKLYDNIFVQKAHCQILLGNDEHTTPAVFETGESAPLRGVKHYDVIIVDGDENESVAKAIDPEPDKMLTVPDIEDDKHNNFNTGFMYFIRYKD